MTVALYNRVRETVTKEEFDLIEGQLQAIDVQLELAISELNWTSKGVWEYIQVRAVLSCYLIYSSMFSCRGLGYIPPSKIVIL